MKRDLAFITNSSNQEAIAKKILEGIVNAKNKPVAAVNTPTATIEPVAAVAKVERKTPVVNKSTTPAGINNSNANDYCYRPGF